MDSRRLIEHDAAIDVALEQRAFEMRRMKDTRRFVVKVRRRA